jgi:hypothetical protein
MIVGKSPLLNEPAEIDTGHGSSETIKVSWVMEGELGTGLYEFKITDLDQSQVNDNGTVLIQDIKKQLVEVTFYKLKVSPIIRVATDKNIKALSKGDHVVCVDDSLGGDYDGNIDDSSLEAGRKYKINDIYDDEELLRPMIVLENNKNGPLFGCRFVKYLD